MRTRMQFAAVALAATLGACHGAEPVFVRSASLAIGLDAAEGRVASVKATNGVELAAQKACDLFELELTRTDDFTNTTKVSSSARRPVACEPVPGGARLVWEGLHEGVARVVCTVRAMPGEAKVRFGFSVTPTNGWAVTSARYPAIQLADRIGADASDDRLMTGHAHGGILHAPGSDPRPRSLASAIQPGSLAVQAALWWDPGTLFYYAAEDARGDVKQLDVRRTHGGIVFSWQRQGYAAATEELDYDYTLAAICGTPQDPVTWHDGADMYRDWARKTRFCSVPTALRKDIPSWMADAPAFTLFRLRRDDMGDPEKIRRWAKDCWGQIAPGVPLVVGVWGWEHLYKWGNPYFPCHPSDEEFVSLVSDLLAQKAYMFPWPSGYHWTIVRGRKDDGTWEYDWREDFDRRVAAHACANRDGSVCERTPGWLKSGGILASMCGGDDWTQRWWDEEVVGGLARRGCRLVQADQNNGGAFGACWSRKHPHPPGNGRWKTDVARKQLKGMSAALRKVHGEGVATYEEPNEQMHDLIGIQLLRDTWPKTEWGSLYGYIYHEYVPMFNPYPPRNDLRWMAYCAAEGQMPRFVPHLSDISRNSPAIPPDFLKMTFGGEGTNKFHTGQNVMVGDALFTPGRRFRLTAIGRTLARPRPNAGELVFHYGVYTRDYQALARGHVGFPGTPEKGWQPLSSEFTMPEGPAVLLRVMLNADAKSRGEVREVKLEVVNPDGSVEPALLTGIGWHNEYMRRWIALHRGEGRPWLAHGRRIKPPRLSCAVVDGNAARPVAFIAAYESLDGRRAFVLANATEAEQEVRCAMPGGEEKTYRLAPRDLRLVRE